ncbi:MAG TPA: helix-turn-helix domain-containing protein [Jatrophihabitans sp.]|jgi:transcriptional regulator with XRE-family HTH domain
MGGFEAQTLWSELGSTMRRMRGAAGVSLRELEDRGTWRRSTISQVENGKARPSRQLVEWFDHELGSDGLLLSIYAEAQAHQLRAVPAGDAPDAATVLGVDPPAGLLVNRSARLQARITLVNSGAVRWTGRRLRRMGAYAGRRLIGSPPDAPVADLAPGDHTDVVVELEAPELPGSAIAYWQLVGAPGRPSAGASPLVAVSLVVE